MNARNPLSPTAAQWIRRNAGVAGIASMLLLCNLHIFTSGNAAGLIYDPAAVEAGEWWRIVTHPFVHVTWYHLLLDGSAFFLLLSEMAHLRAGPKAAVIVCSTAGSLIAAQLASPIVAFHGLCGLSGTAHGMMAFTGLDLMRHSQKKLKENNNRNDDWNLLLGVAAFMIVVIKSGFEALTGKMAVAFLHFGLMGLPVAVTHAGGVLGGIVAYLFLEISLQNHDNEHQTKRKEGWHGYSKRIGTTGW